MQWGAHPEVCTGKLAGLSTLTLGTAGAAAPWSNACCFSAVLALLSSSVNLGLPLLHVHTRVIPGHWFSESCVYIEG